MKALVENILLACVALIARFAFLFYKALVWLVPVAPLVLWLWHAHPAKAAATWSWLMAYAFHSGWTVAALTFLAVYCLYRLYNYADTLLSESTSAGSLLGRLSSRFIAWIGTLKYFSSPLCIVEDPGSYKIKGTDIRKLTDHDTGLLQPGDILLRGYDGYLDGAMISVTGGAKGHSKFFSHAALYVGTLNETTDKSLAAGGLSVVDKAGNWHDADNAAKDKVRNDTGYYSAGPQRVIHSMTKGVHVEDILTFVRCDYLAVLRLREPVQLGKGSQGASPLVRLDKAASNINNTAALDIEARLLRGEAVSKDDVVKTVRIAALEKIGSGYDFLFDDNSKFHRFSCSEFVYYCFKSVHRIIGLSLKKHAFAGVFFARKTITPADLYEAAHPDGPLKVVWEKVD